MNTYLILHMELDCVTCIRLAESQNKHCEQCIITPSFPMRKLRLWEVEKLAQTLTPSQTAGLQCLCWVGQKVNLGFSIRQGFTKKLRMTFLANPIKAL